LLNLIGIIINALGTLLMLLGGIDAFVKIRPDDPSWRPDPSQAIFGDRHGGYIQVGTKGAFIKASKALLEFTGPDVERHRCTYRLGLAALFTGFLTQLIALFLEP